jgi:UDP-N-acetylglucosamine--N-acetylmuramyl-(pentapeptide) pyrophosphoryl-undecaprenol N-acetylglucosamine transferase
VNIAITGGGTGGHLTIAKAIKEELNNRGIKPIFIGSTYGQDKAWFEKDEGFEKCYFFETSGVVNQGKIGKVKSMYKILKAGWICRDIFKKHKIDADFSVGGYSAAPASLASLSFGKKLYIHEQNAVLGKLNKILKPKADMIFSSYLDESLVKSYPVREIFFKNARVRERIKTIIFLGGSQGATAINNFALDIASKLKEKNIKIIHQCGKKEQLRVKEFYEKEKIKVDLFAFSNELESKIKEADFAICRAGASTLWELTASKLPALYVPYPYAAADHQYYNANFLAQKGLSYVKREKDLSVKDLDMIFDSDLTTMSNALGELIEPNGAKQIVDFILFR